MIFNGKASLANDRVDIEKKKFIENYTFMSILIVKRP